MVHRSNPTALVDGAPHRQVNPWVVTLSVMTATFMELAGRFLPAGMEVPVEFFE